MQNMSQVTQDFFLLSVSLNYQCLYPDSNSFACIFFSFAKWVIVKKHEYPTLGSPTTSMNSLLDEIVKCEVWEK